MSRLVGRHARSVAGRDAARRPSVVGFRPPAARRGAARAGPRSAGRARRRRGAARCRRARSPSGCRRWRSGLLEMRPVDHQAPDEQGAVAEEQQPAEHPRERPEPNASSRPTTPVTTRTRLISGLPENRQNPASWCPAKLPRPVLVKPMMPNDEERDPGQSGQHLRRLQACDPDACAFRVNHDSSPSQRVVTTVTALQVPRGHGARNDGACPQCRAVRSRIRPDPRAIPQTHPIRRTRGAVPAIRIMRKLSGIFLVGLCVGAIGAVVVTASHGATGPRTRPIASHRSVKTHLEHARRRRLGGPG